MYYRCKMNHAPIDVSTPAREFYCELCHKIYMKEECEVYKDPANAPLLRAKSKPRGTRSK